MSEVRQMLRPVMQRLGNMIARATVAAVNAATKMQSIQVRLLASEAKDDVEHFEPYGFTSHPHAGAEGIALFFDGDRSHGALVVVADRRYRITGLRSGEMAIHDDLGQKVHLTRSGIVIDGAGLPITITETPKVRMETAMLEVTGEIKDRCDSDGKSMETIRNTYNTHTHNETNTVTNQPNQAM